MMTNTGKFRIVMCCLSLVLLTGISHHTLASEPEEKVGVLTVTGSVRINGKLARTGDIVASGSEVKTAKGSSAVVSLGKLGTIEALPSSTVKLIYTDFSTTHNTASFSILLGDGTVKVSTGDQLPFFVDCFVQSGNTATRPSLRKGNHVFTVESNCGNTSVSVAKGQVELRTKSGFKEITAGGQETAGQARPGCTLSRNR